MKWETICTLANETTAGVARTEAENPSVTFEDLGPLVAGVMGRKAYETGDGSRGMLFAGHALGLTDKVEPMADLNSRIEVEAAQAFGSLQGKVALPEVAQ